MNGVVYSALYLGGRGGGGRVGEVGTTSDLDPFEKINIMPLSEIEQRSLTVQPHILVTAPNKLSRLQTRSKDYIKWKALFFSKNLKFRKYKDKDKDKDNIFIAKE